VIDLSGNLPYIPGMSSLANRTARLEARISPKALATVKRAAEIQGRSVSDFVVAAAQEAAQRTIAEVQMVRLCVTDQEKVAAVLLKRPKAPPALKRAFKAHRDLIRATR